MTTPRYLFRDFCLDPAARELRRNGELVVLPTSALDCLAYLIAQRERAVGRDELIAAVWGRADVADTLLAQTVLRIRRTLGDVGAETSAIRTIARFGYRWVAETQIADAEGLVPPGASAVGGLDAGDETAAASTATTPPAVSPRRRKRLTWSIAAVFALVLLVAASFAWQQRGSGQRDAAAPAASESRIAAVVLPAEVPELAEWSWLRLGLMDLAAGRLRAAGVATPPSESVLAWLRQQPAGASVDVIDPDIAPADALRVRPTAEFRDGAWTVRLAIAAPQAPVALESRDADVLVAAHSAVDLLLVRLGHAPPPRRAAGALALDELLQRTRAAILSDQFDLARELIQHAAPELRGKPEVELRLAQIGMGQGDYQDAQQRLTLLLDKVPGDADPVLRARILNTLGGIEARRGQLAEAEATYSEAAELLADRRDPVGLGLAWMGLGAVASWRGDADTAAAHIARARVELEAGGDTLTLAQADMNLGMLALQRRRPAEALPILQRAEQRLAKLGAREELAFVRSERVAAHLLMLDRAVARAQSDLIWPPEAQSGNQRLRWRLVLSRAGLLAAEGHLDEADALLARIDAEASPGDDAEVRAMAVVLVARIAAWRGAHERAAVLAQAALTPALEAGEPDLWLAALQLQLQSLWRGGQVEAAAQQTRRLLAWVEAQPSDWRRLQAALATAGQAQVERRQADALAAFADAAARASRLGVPEDILDVAAARVPVLIASGDLERAGEAAGTVAAWADRDPRAAWVSARLYRAQDRGDAWRKATERASQLAGQRVLPPADPS